MTKCPKCGGWDMDEHEEAEAHRFVGSILLGKESIKGLVKKSHDVRFGWPLSCVVWAISTLHNNDQDIDTITVRDQIEESRGEKMLETLRPADEDYPGLDFLLSLTEMVR